MISDIFFILLEGRRPPRHRQWQQVKLEGGRTRSQLRRNLEEAVQDFESTPGRDHATLATDIEDNLGRLATDCTMEGKAHDELHKWLMPFPGLSAAYSSATDPQVQPQKLHEIKQALVVFN
jgi:hypothetical protein